MPSLFPSQPSSSRPLAARSFSRVNSIKRDWGDDGQDSAGGLPSSSASDRLEWSPSPEAVRRKKQLVDYPSAQPAPNVMETAQERRRKAILAAFSSNVDSVPVSVPNPTSAVKLPSTVEHIPAPRVRPGIPSRANGSSKRSLPWEEEHDETRKALRSNDLGSDGAASSGTRKTKGKAMNISSKLILSIEQQNVLTQVVAEGKNIFFTGSAGTGKSVLLREIIKGLRKKYVNSPEAVAVTASTGIAACNIGGVTLHSFGGIGLGIEPVEVLIGKIRKNKKALTRWLRTKVLIIDEVSMVDGELFDKLCKIGQKLRKQIDKPWGGIQIIVTGDFFQLPPVTKGGSSTRFAFEAMTWKETISISVNLTKVFRQKDQRFVDMLNEMRFGRLSTESIRAFQSLSRAIVYEDGLEATELFPRREDVERSNSARLAALNTDGWTYNAIDGGTLTDPAQRDKLLGNFMATKFLALKKDAQVMLIKNMDETLVNGSMGRVIGFCHKQRYDTHPNGQWREEDTWDDAMSAEERERKKKQIALLESKLSNSVPLPVVRFSVPGGGYRDHLVDMEAFKVELPNGEVQVSRSQLPLILAWAMSIHKSQGQTLDRVKVDLSKVFEKGQAYVALSRATSLEGLQILGFSARKVQAHPKVAQWSTQLRNLNS